MQVNSCMADFLGIADLEVVDACNVHTAVLICDI